MLLIHSSISNLTILTILKIILLQRDYRTVNFYTENWNDDTVNEVINVLHTETKPIHVLNIGAVLLNRRKEQPVLNILFVVNNVTNGRLKYDVIKRNILPDDVSFILDLSISDVSNQSNIERWMNFSNKVFVVNNFALARLDQLRKRSDAIKLNPFDVAKSISFIKYYIHSTHFFREPANLTIFFQYLTPRSQIAFLDDGNYQIGVDGSITAMLLKVLNSTGIFVSDVSLTYPTIIGNAKKLKGLRPNEKLYEYYPNVLTKNKIVTFNQSITEYKDLHMSPYIVQGDGTDPISSTESLYPHERDCVVVIVPKQQEPRSFLRIIIRNGDVQSIGLAMSALIIARIFIEKAPYDKWFSIFFRTFGILFTQVAMTNNNSLESAWTNVVRGFSTIATVALSAIIYNNLVHSQYREIETIPDLIASNLSVLAPIFLETNLRSRLVTSWPQLLKNIQFININILGPSIIAQNFSFAYILQENPAINYLKIVKFTAEGQIGGRIMTEKLYCSLMSYRINSKSLHKRFVNQFIRITQESGFYNKHLEWAKMLLDALFRPPPASVVDGSKVVITTEKISGVFNLYLIGVLISLVIFIIEISHIHSRFVLKFR